MYQVYSDELYHHGILGQKWGVRRFQYEDGSLTPEGVKRYRSLNASGRSAYRAQEKAISKVVNAEEKYKLLYEQTKNPIYQKKMLELRKNALKSKDMQNNSAIQRLGNRQLAVGLGGGIIAMTIDNLATHNNSAVKDSLKKFDNMSVSELNKLYDETFSKYDYSKARSSL